MEENQGKKHCVKIGVIGNVNCGRTRLIELINKALKEDPKKKETKQSILVDEKKFEKAIIDISKIENEI